MNFVWIEAKSSPYSSCASHTPTVACFKQRCLVSDPSPPTAHLTTLLHFLVLPFCPVLPGGEDSHDEGESEEEEGIEEDWEDSDMEEVLQVQNAWVDPVKRGRIG